jgi:hypothetical protein
MVLRISQIAVIHKPMIFDWIDVGCADCAALMATVSPTFMLSFVIRRVWRCNRARRAVANGTFDQPEALKK